MTRVEPHWSEDVTVLWEDNKWREFLPHKDMSEEEQSNATMRFGIYFGLIVAIYKQNWRWFLLFALAFSLLTVVFYHNNSKPAALKKPMKHAAVVESEERYILVNGKPKRMVTKASFRKKRLPTVNNPMMNAELYHLGSGKLAPSAANPKDPRIKAAVDLAFDDGFFTDPENIYGNRQGRLHFHTVPGGSIGDQNGEFRYFMFGDRTKRTEKERHATFGPSLEEEIRHHKREPPIAWRPSPAV